MDFSKYVNYTCERLLNDDDFICFVIEQKASDMHNWEKFQEENPYKSKIAVSAFETISSYREQEVFTNDRSQSLVFDRITATVALEKTKIKRFNRPLFFKAAAVFVLAMLSTFLYFNYWHKQTVETDFGNIREITLPDGSELILNGNSKVRYASNFSDGLREVWLSGEALFKVKHINIDTNNIKPGEKFIVHCDNMDIEVLGTTFNVKNRHKKTTVGLLTGKIRIDFNDVSEEYRQLVLAPGDLVKHSAKSVPAQQRIANAQQLTAWASRQLMFQDATLDEMIAVLQDDFGYEVMLGDDKLKQLKVEGEINVGSVKELLRILSNTLHLTVKTNNTTITITE
ncbi:FecR family protein [Pedobacter endophyticus]|uniref:FecR domain-containing protein n=1 Tax=Pedobacter endophyticus TaxID=2789740 RepID=A0A7S9KY65_9SPHI|nr:FecR domain-containing protein [Pedobacter endophyticus]QPH39009.1 FecR domain-containing protein [Pedobacter endophyticus]